MVTHSNILAWKISWTEEPGGLWSKRLQRVGYEVPNNLACTHTMHVTRTKTLIDYLVLGKFFGNCIYTLGNKPNFLCMLF